MSITFLCPHCSKSLKASAERVGRRAKCPQCGNDIVITAPDRHKPASPPRRNPTAPSSGEISAPDATGRSQVDSRARAKQPAKYSRSVVVAASFITLIAGYVGGSMHPMNEMLGEFMEASKSITDSYKTPPVVPTVEGMTASEMEESMQAFGQGGGPNLAASGRRFESMPPILGIGDEHSADGFSIALTDVRVGSLKRAAIPGEETGTPEDQYLFCEFRVARSEEGETPSDDEEPEPSDLNYFSISDDEGNFLSHIVSNNADGAETHEIAPGEEQIRIESFHLPGPSTEELTLIVNLQEFGGHGLVGFKIPVGEIDGFSPETP